MYFPYSLKRHVITPADVPAHLGGYFGGLVYGGAFILCATDQWGRIYVLREIADLSGTPGKQAERVKAALPVQRGTDKPEYVYILASPDMFGDPAKAGMTTSHPVSEDFYEAGLQIDQPKEDVLNAYERIRQYMASDVEIETGEPPKKVKVCSIAIVREQCPVLCSLFPVTGYDAKHPDQIDQTGPIAPIKALSYALMSRPSAHHEATKTPEQLYMEKLARHSGEPMGLYGHYADAKEFESVVYS